MKTSCNIFRPLRWLAHLPLVVLPFVAAVVIDGQWLAPALQDRAAAVLAAGGQDWARPTAHGRDVEIAGTAPNRAAVAAAVAAVAQLHGVRRVVARAVTRGL